MKKTFREMWDLFNVNDAKGLNVFEKKINKNKKNF